MRSLEQLKESNDILSGAESQTLRTFCTSNYLDVYTGLNDPVGRLLREDDLEGLKKHLNANFEHRIDLFNKKWGPTAIPVYNVLLTLLFMQPERRSSRMQMIRYLADDAKVPVDGTDLSGTSALMYSISTKPYLDLEFADVMRTNGADVNRRNRYGCTAAHDIVMLRPAGPDAEDRAVQALKWFVQHGGNVDIKEGDGISARFLATRMARLAPKLAAVLKPETGVSLAGASGQKKVGRNDPCTCGSGKKFKVCCGKV